MKLRYLMLGGVCAMTLGIASGLADPQAGDPYTQNPTPQERAQTDRLNTDQQNDAAASNGADAATQAQYQDQQVQYQNQVQQYQGDQDRYQAQKDRYQDDRAEYNYDRSHPYAWWHDRYERASLNSFYDIPRDDLIDLRVAREDGYSVGHIREIERRPDGRVAAVKIAFRDGEHAWVRARDLRYDPDDRIVFTDLSVMELRDLERNS